MLQFPILWTTIVSNCQLGDTGMNYKKQKVNIYYHKSINFLYFVEGCVLRWFFLQQTLKSFAPFMTPQDVLTMTQLLFTLLLIWCCSQRKKNLTKYLKARYLMLQYNVIGVRGNVLFITRSTAVRKLSYRFPVQATRHSNWQSNFPVSKLDGIFCWNLYFSC